jgi:DNA-binding CsgD family transcriptional regulator
VISAPFRRERDSGVAALVHSLSQALDPDELELEFTFQPDGLCYRGKFPKHAPAVVRPVRRLREPKPADDLVLRAPFAVGGLLEGALALLRRRRRPWTGAERARFGLLRPFISQLVSTMAQREIDCEARRWLLAAADSADAPILFFGEEGTILFANEAADLLLAHQTEQGLSVYTERHGVLPLMNHLIRWASGPATARRERVALTNGRSLEARLTPLHGSGKTDPVIRLVTIHERAALTIDDVRPHLIARGISDREADVLSLVLQGLRNAEIARELYICEYTVKDHLKHIRHKLGVTSRGSLVRALHAALPAKPQPLEVLEDAPLKM